MLFVLVCSIVDIIWCIFLFLLDLVLMEIVDVDNYPPPAVFLSSSSRL